LLVIHSFTFIPYFTLRITGRPTHRIPSYNVTGKLLLAWYNDADHLLGINDW